MKKTNIILSLFLFITTSLLFACKTAITDETTREFKISGEKSVYVDEELALSVEGFDASKIAWTSSNTSIATVENGVVTGVSSGSVTIMARTGSYGATYNVQVLETGTFDVGEYNDQVVALLSQMSVEQKIGELFMVGLSGESLSDSEKETLKDYKFGNFYLSKSNISNATQLTSLTKELQSFAKENNNVYAFIGTSSGLGTRNELRNINGLDLSSHAIASMTSASLVEEAGKAIGSELASYGINFDFIDSLNCRTGQSSRDKAAISADSFSSEAQIVSEFATALFRGINSNGVVSAGGLFPIYNSEEKDIGPSNDYFDAFKDTFKAGLDAITVNDVMYSLLDTKNPAIKSSGVINDLLISRLGFSGIVTTTDMNNFSVSQSSSTDLYSKNAVVALYAGVNMFYFSSMSSKCLEYYDDLLRAYNQDLISLDVIDEACAYVLAIKFKHGIMNYNPNAISDNYDYSKREQVANEFKQYVIVQTSSINFEPIKKDEYVLIISFEFDFSSGEESLGEELKRIAVEKGYSSENIDLYSVIEPRELRNLLNPDHRNYIGRIDEYADISKYDRIIVAPPINTISGGSGWQRLSLSDLRDHALQHENVCFISSGTSDVSDAMCNYFATLMVYGSSESDFQSLINYLLKE